MISNVLMMMRRGTLNKSSKNLKNKRKRLMPRSICKMKATAMTKMTRAMTKRLGKLMVPSCLW